MYLKFFNLLSISAIALATLIFLNCKKTETEPNQVSTGSFDAKAAKEWWWGSFRKTNEYKLDAPESSYTTLLQSSNRNISRQQLFKKNLQFQFAKHFSVGNTDLVEVPVIYPKNTLINIDGHKYSPEQNQRIMSSSLHKAFFIKNSKGDIQVRLMTLIPSYEYAQRHNFDISHNSMDNMDKDFSGYLIIRTWNEQLIGITAFEDGKKDRMLKLVPQTTLNNESITDRTEMCSMEPVQVEHQYCIIAAEETEEDAPPASECENWQTYTTTEWQFVCYEVEDIDEDAVNCYTITGMTYEDCLCAYFNYCFDGGNGDGNGNGEQEEPVDCNVANNQFQEAQNATLQRTTDLDYVCINTEGFEADVYRDWYAAKHIFNWWNIKVKSYWKYTYTPALSPEINIYEFKTVSTMKEENLALQYVEVTYTQGNINNSTITNNNSQNPKGKQVVTGKVRIKLKSSTNCTMLDTGDLNVEGTLNVNFHG